MPNIVHKPDVRVLRPAWTQRYKTRSPLDVFRLLAGEGAAPAFLHSGQGFGDAGRYSFIALDAVRHVRFERDSACDPFGELRAALNDEACHLRGEKPPVPFAGGWVGYFSYDLLHRIEHVTSQATVDHGFPLFELAFYRTILTYDHAGGVWTACRLVDDDRPLSSAERDLDDLLERATGQDPPSPGRFPTIVRSLTGNFTRQDYEAAVGRALAYIAAGDIYQVNLSQRFEGRLKVAPHELAVRLFEVNPAPFSAYVPGGSRTIVSTSPERFLRLNGDDVATWPIKGTRPRGSTPDEDDRLRDELLSSEKEQAELTMITDLLRNDLGRVCRYGSITVVQPRVLASYCNVHHTFSKIAGRVKSDLDITDVLRATFPGGSVTGVPKIRAMQIIEELEPTARGPYCGAIGYIGVDGTMDLNIAIRTVLCEDDRLTFQVGGGIVADSQPDDEYLETLHKAKGIMNALGVDNVANLR